ncbi:hypothetical protein AaE_003883 [Aphanomyces astaci]|uniref:Uncharacterized protein n=1 Tax=Aphanomyces astaci TaxID=112090 RepID=A0A6A5A665_APHAT|nr:hypothetical protein AaE_003883 [Aphanomyces astaci]
MGWDMFLYMHTNLLEHSSTPLNTLTMNVHRDSILLLYFTASAKFRHMYHTKDLYKAEINEIKTILKDIGQSSRRPTLFRPRRVEPPVPECPEYQSKRIKVSGVRVPFSIHVARRYIHRYTSLPTIHECEA